jgi:subtilisin family serine protease
VSSLDGEASLRRDLRFKLFKGASIQFENVKKAEEVAAKVAEMPQVKRVFPVRRYPVPHHTVHSTGDNVEAMLSKRQESGNDTFTPHLMTQVNKFRDAGITGKGIKIAVIDTGVSVSEWEAGRQFGRPCVTKGL